MSSGLLGVALTGLNAAQIGLRTTQQNIANANTPGYRVQTVNQSTQQPQYTGAGYVGNGVTIAGITHQYSQFLDNEVLLNQTQLSRYTTLSDRAAQLDKLLGDSSSSLSSTLDAFFAGAQELANDPASASTRQNMLSSSQNLAGRFNMLANQLQAYRSSSNTDLQSLVAKINDLATQISQANAGIAQTAAVNGQLPNDLVDARDKLVEDLNKLVNVTRQDAGNGMVNVFIGSGQPLVAGTKANSMGTKASANDASVLDPTISVGGSSLTLTGNLITGGELGGLLDYRQNVLLPALDNLNRIAMSVASAVNGVQRGGLDYNLTAGSDLFASPVAPSAGAPQMSFSANVGNPQSLDPAGYTLSWDGTNYTLTANTSGISVTGGTLAAVTNGWGFSLVAASPPAAGDSWTIAGSYAHQISVAITDPKLIAAAAVGAGGPGNNANALLLAGLQNSQSMNSGTATFATAYNQTVSNTAMQASQSDTNKSAFQTLTDSAVGAQQAQVGVNLDEEAAKLIQFQSAYQASAKALQIANSLFNDILNALQ